MTTNTKRLAPQRIAVLLGGDSAEREISLQSGAAVVSALSAGGHDVVSIDPRDVALSEFDWSKVDVAFLALHGGAGENGEIQAVLDAAGVCYTGSGAAASRLAFSKSAAKERFFQWNVPTPAYVLIHEADDDAQIHKRAHAVGFPLVVKPNSQGSSLGVTIVRTPEELPHALLRCFHLDSFGVLEAAVSGTEWTQAVLDEELLPLIQIQTHRSFFDYDAKYADGATGYQFDFTLPRNVEASIRSAALGAVRSLDVAGVARVDLMLDQFSRPWVLEVNTIPGLTDHSLVPKAAARKGWGLGQLCEAAVQSALASQPEQDRRNAA
ncbi:MAG: D-alanine--D-alanine ligase [Planctomycetaceae bacterium]|nr:D-alanine--D-alanine ligase [Planctomycetaceae bacterium]